MKTILKYSLLLVLLTSCEYVKYSKGVKEDTRKQYVFHKELIKHTAFEGKILEKQYKKDSEINNYQITLNIDDAAYKKLKSGWPGLPPYYQLPEHNIVNFTVSPQIYKAVNVGKFISKESNSNNFTINNKNYSYLSTEEGKWLAE